MHATHTKCKVTEEYTSSMFFPTLSFLSIFLYFLLQVEVFWVVTPCSVVKTSNLTYFLPGLSLCALIPVIFPAFNR